MDEGDSLVWSPDSRKVAYIDQYDNLDIINSDGSDKTRLVPEVEAAPRWAPDGERILYRIWGAGYNLGYYIANIRTGETYYFGFQRGMTQPVWSPDADKVLYTDEGYIYIINADGTGKTTLTEGSNPQWSPDGKKIAYQFTEKFGKEVLGEYIYVINADGTGQTKLAEGSNPIWSPTSK